jgi:hypothetical protein
VDSCKECPDKKWQKCLKPIHVGVGTQLPPVGGSFFTVSSIFDSNNNALK